MKKLLLVLILVGVASVAAAYWLKPSSTSGSEVAYTFASVDRGPLTEVVSSTGQLSPREISLVTSLLPGQVIKIFENADYNRHVKENEPLLQLDPSQAKIKLEQAKAAVAAAKADVGRAEATEDAARVSLAFHKELQEKDLGPKAKVEEATYLRNAAQAGLAAARIKVTTLEKVQKEAELGLEKTTIRALVSGVIVDRKVYLGQMVGAQSPIPLFKIASDLSQMEVNAQVAEGDISKVRVGLDADFTVYAYSEGNIKFTGKVKQIHYLPNNVQGAVFYNTVISVTNRHAPGSSDNWMLRPGMTATVDILRRKHLDAWKLPTDALNLQLEEHYQSVPAQAKLKNFQRPDRDDWRHVWILDAEGKPWPIFVRIGGNHKDGEPGIKDGQFNEVLEWDPELKPEPNPKDPGTFPKVIISAPPVNKPSIFEKPTRIIS